MAWIGFGGWLLLFHTGMNAHGGNPTVFGVPDRANPLLGIGLIVGSFLWAAVWSSPTARLAAAERLKVAPAERNARRLSAAQWVLWSVRVRIESDLAAVAAQRALLGGVPAEQVGAHLVLRAWTGAITEATRFYPGEEVAAVHENDDLRRDAVGLLTHCQLNATSIPPFTAEVIDGIRSHLLSSEVRGIVRTTSYWTERGVEPLPDRTTAADLKVELLTAALGGADTASRHLMMRRAMAWADIHHPEDARWVREWCLDAEIGARVRALNRDQGRTIDPDAVRLPVRAALCDRRWTGRVTPDVGAEEAGSQFAFELPDVVDQAIDALDERGAIDPATTPPTGPPEGTKEPRP